MDEKKRKKSKKKSRSAHLDNPNPSVSASPAQPQCSNRDLVSPANDFPSANGDVLGRDERSDGVLPVEDRADKSGVVPEPAQIMGEVSLSAPDPSLISVENDQQENSREAGLEVPIEKNIVRHCAGIHPDAVSNRIEPENHHSLDKQLLVREELSVKEQVVCQLREALVTESAKTEALRVAIDELRVTHDITEAGSQRQIQQLREEIVQLREMESHQLKKEADLQGEMQQLREEVVQLIERQDFQLQKEVGSQQEIQQLRAEIIQLKEMESLYTKTEAGLHVEILRLGEEIMQLREMHDLQLQKEAVTHAETWQLREENLELNGKNTQLLKEVEEMKDAIEQLLLERRQLTAKMVAIQTGMHQLEREASIRARVEDELTVATAPETSKQWLRWGSTKDPVVEAAAVAEESRIQMVAAATMVERLVTENSELAEKVNEQSALIDRLTLKYSSVMEMQSNGTLECTGSNEIVKSTSTNTQEVETKFIVAQAMHEVLPPETSSSCEEEFHAQPEAVPGVASVFSTANTVLGLEFDQLKLLGVEFNQLKQEVPAEIIDDPPARIVIQENPHQDNFIKPHELKPFSDAPILGAPIRLFTFITKYVSGADLVRVENSQ